MRIHRVLAVGGLLTLAAAPAFAATFMSGRANTNASAFLGTSNSGLPGVTDTHNASAASLPAGALNPLQSAVITANGADTVIATSGVSAAWTSANAGTFDSRSGWTMTLPDRDTATIAQATTIDQSLGSTRPAWDYVFAATGLDNLFTMNFDVAVTGNPAGLGAWDIQVFEDGVSVRFAALANGTATGTFTQALAAGHTFDVRLTSNEGLLLPKTLFGSVNGEDLAHFDFNISQAAAAGGVPEPSTWALGIMGFGLTGAALRRRSRRQLA